MAGSSEAPGREALLASIPALVRRMHEAGATSVDVRAGGARLSVTTPVAARGAIAPAPEAPPGMDAERLHAIVSPLAGVAFFAPGPEQPPYVQVGDVVAAGQVVALVEAMKVFNEIHADRGGRVVRLAVASGSLVGAGTPLLHVEADERRLPDGS